MVVDTLLGPHLLTAIPVGNLIAAHVADAVRQSRGSRDGTLRPWIFGDVGMPSTFPDTAAGEYLEDYPTQVRLGTVYESGGFSYWRRIISTCPVRSV
ncbi:MAG: hypothetical protein ABIT01_02080 [Thermoanaerobaculia bacterium]